MKLLTLLLCLIFLNLKCFGEEKRLLIIGDSIASSDSIQPNRDGWGSYIQNYLLDAIEVNNHATRGKSSKTYLISGIWNTVKFYNPKMDFTIISFGHNDDSTEFWGTDPNTEFKENLELYIDEVIERGGVPILMTPLIKHIFIDGNVDDSHLLEYSSAIKDVATERDVWLIDLRQFSIDVFNSLGEQASADLMDFDGLHLSRKGANYFAGLIAIALPEELKQYQVHADFKLLFNPELKENQNWLKSAWLGWVNTTHSPWFLHAEHGWIYSTSTGSDSVWTWSEDFGWSWSDSATYPWIWVDELGIWMYYLVDSKDPRWFYNSQKQAWEARF
jgi:lysophospholipase L1-like esterase